MRRIAAVLITLTVIVGAVGLSATPAAAFKKPMFTIAEGKQVVKHGGIPGNYPATTASVPGPRDCGNDGNTAPQQGSCDLVPIKIVKPAGLGPTDDFFVTIVITWEPSDEVDQVGAVNDLDVYFWDNMQVAKRTNKNSTSFTRLAASTDAHQPEKISLFSPDLGDYNMTIVNWAGPNLSYTLTAELKIESFDSPFEDLGPAFASRNRSSKSDDASDSFVAPVDLSGEDTPSGGAGGGSFGDLGDAAGGAPTLDEVPVLPDSDFASIGTGGGASALAAPPTDLGPGRTRLAAAPGPVSGVLLLFWMLIVPLALLAAGVVVLLRRSRNSFSFG